MGAHDDPRGILVSRFDGFERRGVLGLQSSQMFERPCKREVTREIDRELLTTLLDFLIVSDGEQVGR